MKNNMKNNMKNTMKNTALLKTMQGLAMSLLISVAAHASTSVYVFPVGATSTPNLDQPPWTVSNLLIASNPYFSNNGVGLNTGDQVGLVSDLPTYASMVDNANSAMYRPASVTASLVLDLGGTFSLNGLRLWNYAESYSGVTYNNRGVKDFTLSFSTDGGITFSNAQNFTAAIGGTLSGNRSAAQAFSFGDISANYVKFDITSSQGSDFSSGFGALRFTAVPEPSSAALLGGLGTLLLMRRRRL